MANEVRLVDADELLNSFRPEDEKLPLMAGLMRDVKRMVGEHICNLPTIDPESLRPEGRWEKYWCETDLIGHMYEVCPNCRSCEILDTEKFWDSNYCPNCGAKMMEG